MHLLTIRLKLNLVCFFWNLTSISTDIFKIPFLNFSLSVWSIFSLSVSVQMSSHLKGINYISKISLIKHFSFPTWYPRLYSKLEAKCLILNFHTIFTPYTVAAFKDSTEVHSHLHSSKLLFTDIFKISPTSKHRHYSRVFTVIHPFHSIKSTSWHKEFFEVAYSKLLQQRVSLISTEINISSFC